MPDNARWPGRLLPMAVHDELLAIAGTMTIQSFSVNLVNIFVPLVLLSKGASVQLICSYYLGYAVAKLALNYPSMLVLARFGPRVGMSAAILAATAYLVSLGAVTGLLPVGLIVVSPLALAAANSFLWNTQHTY